jgi:non-ribosomal peptide synthetase component F
MSVSNPVKDEVSASCLSGPFLPEQNITISQLIDQKAAQNPQATALCLGQDQLSYGELRQRSNQLAHFLRAKGIGAGQFIGICMDHGFEMVVGLLGVAKSGAAYVPLDPSFPAERLKFMITDAEIRYILSTTNTTTNTTTKLAKLAQAIPTPPIELLALDTLGEQLALFPRDHAPDDVPSSAPNNTPNSTPNSNPDNTPSLQSPVYLIYTSGSTGKPKGVLVPHRSLVNFLRSMQISPGIRPDDRLLALTTISFDISGLELYLPLITGASLRLLTRQEARNSSILNQLTESGEITLMQATPTTWQMMLNGGWQGHPKLKALVGGEAFPPALAQRMVVYPSPSDGYQYFHWRPNSQHSHLHFGQW